MGETTHFEVPYSEGADPVNTVDDTMQALAERIDQLLGESNTAQITPSAVDVQTQLAINYARTYDVPPRVFIQQTGTQPTGTITNLWPSGETTTGFTLNVRASTTAQRSCNWLAKPVRNP